MKNALKSMTFVYLLMALAPYGMVQKSLTAGDVVERIKQHVTCPWSEETVDTFKSGSPETKVTGIVTTFMATMEVLKKAVDMHCNMIITHEPTYYNHLDDTGILGDDAVLTEKQQFIREHGLVVFRFHDHWHRTMPDGISVGVINQLGWEDHEIAPKSMVFRFEQTTLKAFAGELKARFPTAELRVIGNPEMELTNAGLILGAPASTDQIAMLERDDVQVLVAGESREWETVEYVRDAVAQGRQKACIWLGHAISEEPGMAYCAEWLRKFITGVPVHFVAAGDPYWVP